jgi:hypothetical protein
MLAFGCIVSGCAGLSVDDPAPESGTSGQLPAFANVQNTTFDVTVENRAGLPLLDVLVAIKPVGRPAYTKFIPRMEGGQKRALVLSEFTGNDGTQFSLNIARPREISITARDMVGTKFEMTTPWKR